MNLTTNQNYYSQTLIVRIYEIKTAHIYKDFRSNKEMFDFSNYYY